MKGIGSSIERKLFVVTFLFIVIVALIVGAISFVIYRSDSIEYNADRALSVAETVAAGIDADEFLEILETHEKTPYWEKTLQMVNRVYIESGMKYLYILGDINQTDVTYFMDAYSDKDNDEPVDLGEREETEAHDEKIFEVLSTGKSVTTDIYNSEGYGMMVSGYAPIIGANGRAVGLVGVDVSLEQINADVLTFTINIVIAALALSVVFSLIIRSIIKKMIGNPIHRLTQASEKLAGGDVDIDLTVSGNDEIATLTRSFISLSNTTKEQVNVVQQIAQGDYSVTVKPRSDRDLMNLALKTVLDENNSVFVEIQSSAAHVASVAGQIASGAQNLASGSTQQASSTQELSSTIAEVLSQTKDNAKNAQEALESVINAGKLMQVSMDYMEQMQSAMDSISESSSSIEKIIKTIDDIAFQTNILALNASVEAARAGQHGKGFAVVADEVRNLANRSAEAAKETSALIQKSVVQVEKGEDIVAKTSESIKGVVESSNQTQEKIVKINNSARSQEAAINQINASVEQISRVVQTNTATSEQSAAMSEEMSGQAGVLSQVISRFQLSGSPKASRNPDDEFLLTGR